MEDLQYKISIDNLRIDTRIGICDWEKLVDQSLFFDLDMQVDGTAVADSDAIGDALDYAAVAEFVEQLVVGSQLKLLESLLADIARQLMARYEKIQQLDLTVRKPQAISNADCAKVSLSVNRP